MKSVYENNKAMLEVKFPGIGERLERYLALPEEKVGAYLTRDDRPGLFVRMNEGVIQLNSKYSSKVYADIWAENVLQREQLSRHHVLVVFGFGNGDYINALCERLPEDCYLICYEPSRDIFMTAVQSVDMQQICRENRAVFVEQLNMNDFDMAWREVVTLANGNLVHFVSLPAYVQMFEKELQCFIERVAQNNELTWVEENTRISFAAEFVKNQIALLPYLIHSYSVADLFKQLPAAYPAIVVAAGPSLKKNIRELKKAKNKALIIAIDTSVKLLLEEGIAPDIYVTVDARKPVELFSDERIHEIPVCVAPCSIPEAFEKQKKQIFVSMGNCYIGQCCNQFDKELGFLGDGGTVAQDAFYLAVEAGMSPVILVGQDLAYTDKQTHAQGAYSQKVNVEDMDQSHFLWVEDVYGEQVPTIPNLNIYRKWYERVIASMPEGIRVIDATEGGAKIAGTEVCSLKDVIGQECTREFDYSASIAATEPLFSEEEKQKLVKTFRDIPVRFREIEHASRESLAIYRRLAEEELPIETIKKYLDKLRQYSEQTEEHLEYVLVEPYVEAVSQKVVQNLDEESENPQEDLEWIIERGMQMSEAIQRAIPELLPEVEKMLEKL